MPRNRRQELKRTLKAGNAHIVKAQEFYAEVWKTFSDEERSEAQDLSSAIDGLDIIRVGMEAFAAKI